MLQQRWVLPPPPATPLRLSPPVITSPFPHFLRPPRTRCLLAASPPVLGPSSSAPEGRGLTARERRQLRNERRERSDSGKWREEVEERLLVKPKKRYASWTEELNLDNLAKLGPQWWVVRVSRVTGQETAERLARAFVRTYPEMQFKVYMPSVKVKRKLKNGSLSVKPKAIFPGCVFLYCVLNKEIHDFVRECDGIGGFLGSRVGNTKRQINRPKPVAADEMETISRQAKEEQESIDRAYEEQHGAEESPDGGMNESPSLDTIKTVKSKTGNKSKRRTRKSSESSESSSSNKEDRSLVPGSNVCVLSGPFTEYTGRLKELNQKTGKATVGFMLFGKESFVELEVDQIVAETS